MKQTFIVLSFLSFVLFNINISKGQSTDKEEKEIEEKLKFIPEESIVHKYHRHYKSDYKKIELVIKSIYTCEVNIEQAYLKKTIDVTTIKEMLDTLKTSKDLCNTLSIESLSKRIMSDQELEELDKKLSRLELKIKTIEQDLNEAPYENIKKLCEDRMKTVNISFQRTNNWREQVAIARFHYKRVIISCNSLLKQIEGIEKIEGGIPLRKD